MSERAPDIRIATVTDPHWEVVVFTTADGGMEAIITSPDSPRKPTHLMIGPPPAGKRIVTTRLPDGSVEITYRDVV